MNATHQLKKSLKSIQRFFCLPTPWSVSFRSKDLIVQLVSARLFVQEVLILIPMRDLKSLFY